MGKKASNPPPIGKKPAPPSAPPNSETFYPAPTGVILPPPFPMCQKVQGDRCTMSTDEFARLFKQAMREGKLK